MDEMKTGVGPTDMETAKSDEVGGSTMTELMLVLFDGAVSTKVEFVTVVEFWMVVPGAVPETI